MVDMLCLVIEDDASMCAFVRESLEILGHQVDIATTCAEGLRAIKTRKYNFIVLDFHLPDGDSLCLSEYAGATLPDVRTLLLTGSTVFPSGEERLMAPGVDWILRKPVPLSDLEAIFAYVASEAKQCCV